jgi:hypothetical protein
VELPVWTWPVSFNFKTQLKAGQLGEVLYLSAHPELTRTDGMTADFLMDDGKGIELKTDFYTVEATPNFFMERWSVKEQEKPGGPWQSASKGVDYFAYFYVPSLVVYTFPVDRLLARLKELEPTLAPFPIKNSSYTTIGYRVARDLVQDLATVTRLRVVVDSV